ncbi:MAG TPA: DUF2206 domain-containing protein [Candidatus Bathyarchaeia archaeon]|nr:DUF2206 domain-containing protein [Candidatus Bathyarchaeia archaeon]
MVLNPLVMNDWPRKRTLTTVLGLQFLVWALIGLDAAGVQILLLRALFAFAYLLFVPGMLVLRALRLHKLGGVRTPLFAVGLSLAAVMAIGLLMTMLYPVFGFERPLALVPVVMTEGVIITFLAVLSYWRDPGPTDGGTIDRRDVLSPPVLALCVLPFVSIFATYAMNAYGSNLLLLALIIIIAITALWISTSASVPKELYPLAVFVIALALLYHASLISPYVWGWDIQKELYSANAVLTNAQWSVHAPGATNAVLSVTLLAPITSIVSGVSVVWIFKTIYPLLFALVPVGLFVVFQKQTSDRIAFLASLFVTFLFTFFTEMPSLARQEIAELFLVLLLMLLVDKRVGSEAGKPLLYTICAIFAASVVVSHYALALIFITYLVVAWLMLFLVDNPAMRRLQRAASSGPSAKPSSRPKRMLTLPFIVSFAAFTAAWYVTLGSAALSGDIAPIFAQIGRTLFTPSNVALALGIGAAVYACALVIVYVLAKRAQRKPSTLLFGVPVVSLSASLALARYYGVSANQLLQAATLSPLHEVAELLYLLGFILIILGLAALALRRCRFTFDQEFAALALASFVILMTAAAIPLLALTVNTTRLYQISTLLLAPFCVTGALLIGWVPGLLPARQREKTGVSLAYKLVAVLFVVMLLFGTGLVYEVTRQDPTSFFLNDAIDAPRFNAREVAGAQWLYAVKASARPVYADLYRGLLWTSLDSNHSLVRLPSHAPHTPLAGYVYLGTFNLLTGTSAQQVNARSLLSGTQTSHSSLVGIADGRNRVFDDGGAVVFYH